MSNNFSNTAVLTKIYVVSKSYPAKDSNNTFWGHTHALSPDASGCKESQFYSLPFHVFARCACFRFSTIFAYNFPRNNSQENCRQFAGNKKYVENLKQASGEIFVVSMKKNFGVNCIENLKKVVLAHATACNTLRFLQYNSCKCK